MHFLKYWKAGAFALWVVWPGTSFAGGRSEHSTSSHGSGIIHLQPSIPHAAAILSVDPVVRDLVESGALISFDGLDSADGRLPKDHIQALQVIQMAQTINPVEFEEARRALEIQESQTGRAASPLVSGPPRDILGAFSKAFMRSDDVPIHGLPAPVLADRLKSFFDGLGQEFRSRSLPELNPEKLDLMGIQRAAGHMPDLQMGASPDTSPTRNSFFPLQQKTLDQSFNQLIEARFIDPLTGFKRMDALYELLQGNLPLDFRLNGMGPELLEGGDVLLLDIDRFGLFNQILGPRRTDEILGLFADILYAGARNSNLKFDIFRKGGEEIIILAAPGKGMELAESIRMFIEHNFLARVIQEGMLRPEERARIDQEVLALANQERERRRGQERRRVNAGRPEGSDQREALRRSSEGFGTVSIGVSSWDSLVSMQGGARVERIEGSILEAERSLKKAKSWGRNRIFVDGQPYSTPTAFMQNLDVYKNSRKKRLPPEVRFSSRMLGSPLVDSTEGRRDRFIGLMALMRAAWRASPVDGGLALGSLLGAEGSRMDDIVSLSGLKVLRRRSRGAGDWEGNSKRLLSSLQLFSPRLAEEFLHFLVQDDRTVLWNRSTIYLLADALEHHYSSLTVGFMEIVGLKDINEVGGYEAGDNILSAWGRFLLELADGADIRVVRLLGKEFAAFGDPASIGAFIARVREAKADDVFQGAGIGASQALHFQQHLEERKGASAGLAGSMIGNSTPLQFLAFTRSDSIEKTIEALRASLQSPN